MTYRQDIQKQSSLSTQKGRGMSMSFAEHLTEHILQLSLLVGRKCCNPLFQPTLVNRPYLVGENLSVAPLYSEADAERVAVDRRSDQLHRDGLSASLRRL